MCMFYLWLFWIVLVSIVQSQSSGDIRLVGGLCRYQGRLEVFYNGEWGTVCDDNFDYKDARVVCRQLGASSWDKAHIYTASDGKGQIWIDELSCGGYEAGILNCGHSSFGSHDCSHAEDVGVWCFDAEEGDLRIMGSLSITSGRLEIFHSGKWGTICDDNFDTNDAIVACRQLKLGRSVTVFTATAGNGTIWLDDLNCGGGESSIDKCSHIGWGNHNCVHGEDVGIACSGTYQPYQGTESSIDKCYHYGWGRHDCSHSKDVGISCLGTYQPYQGDLRLVDGTGDWNGRLEVYYSGSWGTVCNYAFDIVDARVACRQLRYNIDQATFYTDGKGDASQSINLNNLRCTGNEDRLDLCPHSGWRNHLCFHSEDVGIKCHGNCIIDGGWGLWTSWTVCSTTCGNGRQERSRQCNDPSPSSGGVYCSGIAQEVQYCSSCPCPVNGGWGQWTAWTACNVTCGSGQRKRQRNCDNPVPSNGGVSCQGQNDELSSCILSSCPVNGGWGQWTSWTDCSTSCGNGTQERLRTCNNPSPSSGGLYCAGDEKENNDCRSCPCPVDGRWGQWTAWTACSLTCGSGQRKRQRYCDDPIPSYGGALCEGHNNESSSCLLRNCPVDGGWGQWTSWTGCSTTCGNGTQERFRTCDNPTPSSGGIFCPGEEKESQNCQSCPCPVDGSWSQWTAWTSCSLTCGSGQRKRQRYCDDPEPLYGGDFCEGQNNESLSCLLRDCPVDGGWGQWASWTDCSTSCGNGTQERLRQCNNPTPSSGGLYCPGEEKEIQYCQSCPCPVNGDWSQWTSWTDCSVTCGSGQRKRQRYCNNPVPSYGGALCEGQNNESLSCLLSDCPVDGGWGQWTPWTECSTSCGNGTQERLRQCNNPTPSSGGLYCAGEDKARQDCLSCPCPVNGYWNNWTAWTVCSLTCGYGQRKRHRYCDNPEPLYGGALCEGQNDEFSRCFLRDCPVNGGWSKWSEWNPCNETNGHQNRTRDCDSPAPAFGGSDCEGEIIETQPCYSPTCLSALSSKLVGENGPPLSTGMLAGIMIVVMVLSSLISSTIMFLILRRRQRNENENKSTPDVLEFEEGDYKKVGVQELEENTVIPNDYTSDMARCSNISEDDYESVDRNKPKSGVYDSCHFTEADYENQAFDGKTEDDLYENLKLSRDK